MDWFLDILVAVLLRLVVFPEPEAYMRRIFGEELGLARSINFTESGITMTNILGQSPKTRVPDWNNDGYPHAYVPKRTVPWYGNILDREPDPVLSKVEFGAGEIPEELLNRDKTKHTERKVSALIDLPLWDRAKWGAILYLWPAEMDSEPWMALGFENGEAARAIFKEWRTKFGDIDEEDRIRVSMLTGVDRFNPNYYSVIVGSNLIQSKPRFKNFVSVSRIHRMKPSTSKNLSEFANRFGRIGTYRLMPAEINLGTGKHKPYVNLAIQKRQVRISPAWQVEEHDPDGVGIFPDDKPIIPEGVCDAPVLRLIERKNKRAKQF